jgi:hypothetical protein
MEDVVVLATFVALETTTSSTTTLIPSSAAVFLELCTDSAGLTPATRAESTDGLGIDSARNVHNAKAPLIRAYLSTTDVASNENTAHVHAVPPCGTPSCFKVSIPFPIHSLLQGHPVLRHSDLLYGLGAYLQFKVFCERGPEQPWLFFFTFCTAFTWL